MDTPVLVIIGPPSTVPSGGTVAAGFPSPAADHEENGLDLTRRFVRHPLATFVVKATGESLSGMGIYPGDFIVVDRSRTPRDGDVVIALIGAEFTAKVYRLVAGRVILAAANPACRDVPWGEGCEIWGVATSIHRDLLAATA